LRFISMPERGGADRLHGQTAGFIPLCAQRFARGQKPVNRILIGGQKLSK
jgi:hypothetical protein